MGMIDVHDPLSEPQEVRQVQARIDRAVHWTAHPKPRGNEWLTCCGTELPITMKWFEIGRCFDFYTPTRGFKTLFHRALMSLGLDHQKAIDDLKLLSKHKRHLKLRKPQVWGLYGLQHGVFDANGRFKPEFGELGTSGMPVSSGDWPLIIAEANRACGPLPETACIQDEYRWIVSRLYEWPDFTTAPSRTAVKYWLALSDPINRDPSLLREFMRVSLSKRLSPGDPSAKSMSSFEEDADVPDTEAERAELQRRLGRRLFTDDEDAA